LFFIPAGKPVSNGSELIGNGRLRVLLDRLAPAFDWIILDSPPIVPVSDAKLLADLCDGVLVVIRSGSTPFDLAQKACREFPKKQLLGVVLNGVAPGQAYTSYFYQKRSNSTGKVSSSGERPGDSSL
jgi:Mrp family chromosome partitioning ATPase